MSRYFSTLQLQCNSELHPKAIPVKHDECDEKYEFLPATLGMVFEIPGIHHKIIEYLEPVDIAKLAAVSKKTNRLTRRYILSHPQIDLLLEKFALLGVVNQAAKALVNDPMPLRRVGATLANNTQLLDSEEYHEVANAEGDMLCTFGSRGVYETREERIGRYIGYYNSGVLFLLLAGIVLLGTAVGIDNGGLSIAGLIIFVIALSLCAHSVCVHHDQNHPPFHHRFFANVVRQHDDSQLRLLRDSFTSQQYYGTEQSVFNSQEEVKDSSYALVI